MAGNPWFKFYPSDWRGSTRLKLCSARARAVLVEMMCIMHESEPYGHLVIAGKPVSDAALARQSGLAIKEIAAGREELQANGVVSVTPDGVLFNPRMVRDEQIRKRRAAGGKKGGNPTLITDNPKDNPKDNLPDNHIGSPQIPDARCQKPEESQKASVSTKPADADVENSKLGNGQQETPQAEVMGTLRRLRFRCDKHDGSIVKTLLLKRLSPETLSNMAEGLALMRERGELTPYGIGPPDALTMLIVYSAEKGTKMPLWRKAEITFEQQRKDFKPAVLNNLDLGKMLR